MEPNASATNPLNEVATILVPGGLDARVIDQSQGNRHIVHAGGIMEVHYGPNITVSPQAGGFATIVPAARQLSLLPRCPPPCSNYVHRPIIENLLDRYFFRNSTSSNELKRRCFVLHGLGGTGKSQSASKFIYKNVYDAKTNDKRFSEAISVDAISAQTIEQSLADFALAKGVGSTFGDALLLLATRNANANWIMFFNNADDPGLDLSKYFPKCTHGNIIITTRNRQARRYGLGQGSEYAVSGMEHDEARDLLLKQAQLFSLNPSSTVFRGVLELIEELSYFPLSVSQAGAYILAKLCTPKDYLEMFRTRRKRLLLQHNEMLNSDEYPYTSVQATLSISFERLDPLAQQLLQLYSFLNHEHIQDSIFKALFWGLSSYMGYYKRLLSEDEKIAIAALKELRKALATGGKWDIGKYRGIIEILQRYSLASYNALEGTCAVHPLIQEFIRESMKGSEHMVLRHATIILLGSSLMGNMQQTVEELAFIRSLAPHADAVAKGHEISFSGCRNRLAAVYFNIGNYDRAGSLRKEYVEMCSTLLGRKHIKTLTSMNDLALVYRGQGKFDEAAELHLQVLEIQKERLGADHPDTLTSMNNIASVYRHQGKLDEAAELHLQVLATMNEKFEVDHPLTLTSMNNLASVYRHQGKLNEAVKLQSQVSEVMKEKLGADHPHTLTSMNNLASVYRHQGKLDEAVELHVDVLGTRKKSLGADHPDTLISMNNLASVYRDQRKLDEADELYSQVLAIGMERYGPNHFLMQKASRGRVKIAAKREARSSWPTGGAVTVTSSMPDTSSDVEVETATLWTCGIAPLVSLFFRRR